MKIILTSIGTRGDMEPFLAIGEILKEKGHDVLCLFPEQFRTLAEDSGLEFSSLGKEFIELLESPSGKIVMSGGNFGWKKLKAILRLLKIQSNVNRDMVRIQYEVIESVNPDRIIHNGKVIYPVIWSLENQGKTTLINAVPYLHYVKDQAHLVFHRNFGPFLNKQTYKLANFGLIKTIMNSLKWLDKTKKIKQKQIQKALFTNNCVYTISPTLFVRPDYWAENIRVLGYRERNKTKHWQANQPLIDFVAKHEKLVFVTFGSMVNTDPLKKTKILLNILERNNIPAIINTASGGLVEVENYNRDLIHYVDTIPYDWIFPKIYAVIHHGGSGTTHTALKYGCATLILPHIIDQYVWNKIIYKHGAGPLGVDISKINRRRLEPKILDLWNTKSFKEKAENLGERMKKENLNEELYQAIIS